MDRPENSDWFVAQTQPRKEKVAAWHLGNQGFSTFLPRISRTRRHAHRFDTVLEPLFPGYLFVAIDPEAVRWRAVNGTIGVNRLITDAKGPVAVRDRFVEKLQRLVDDQGVILSATDLFHPGDNVRFQEGPFAEWVGKVISIKGPERVRLLLTFMGREISVEASARALSFV